MFEQQVRRTPDSVAVISEGKSLTYRELYSQVNQLARYLRERQKVGADSPVGLLIGRSERMLISILGILAAGGAYVPISPDYPASRIAYILRDAAPVLLLTEDHVLPLVKDYSGTVVSWDSLPATWSGESITPLPDFPVLRQLAYIMYTSGSTGLPKGVMVEHGNLSNFVEWCVDEYRNSVFDIVYAGTPYGFDLSNIELFFPLAVGRRIRLLPSSNMMAPYLKRDRRVLINTVPSLVQQLMRVPGILEHVTVLNLGGEAVPPSLAASLHAYPLMEVRNMYGPTETTSTAINYRMNPGDPEVLIGKPIANTVVYIVDEDGKQLPAGVKGEIWIGGHGVTRGYWNRPELTRERFIDDPFRRGERLYRTGDIGMWLADENIRYFGRNDNQIKIRGYRIELDEIGNRLANCPGVRDAVAGLRKSGSTDRLVAVVVAQSNQVTAGDLTERLRDHLPPYMIPEEVEFRDALPLTPTGKIDRQALFAKPAPADGECGEPSWTPSIS
jgi:amino acid adenylation domain-containing protein